MRNILTCILFSLTAGAANIAAAVTIERQITYDLTTATVRYAGPSNVIIDGSSAPVSTESFVPVRGDIIDITVNFAPGQLLTLSASSAGNNILQFSAVLLPTVDPQVPPWQTAGSVTVRRDGLELIGVTGNLPTNFPPPNVSGPGGVLDIRAAGLAYLPYSVSFSGFHITGTVSGTPYPFLPDTAFSNAFVYFQAGDYMITAVPEPSIAVMLMGGLIVVGGVGHIRHCQSSSNNRRECFAS